jgi:hypothetical protein
LTLSAAGLADLAYYNFVLDAVRHLCSKADVFPCVLDAAVFASFDQEAWDEHNLPWSSVG